MSSCSPYAVGASVVIGAWAGILVAAIHFGARELARLRGELARYHEGVWGGERPLSEGEVEPPPPKSTDALWHGGASPTP